MTCPGCDEDEYEAYLTSLYGTVKLGILEFDAGKIIRELDETAFDVGMADFDCLCEEENDDEEEE